MKCNLCHSDRQSLIDFGNFPIAHHYLKTREQKELEYPFELGFCNCCNHVFIANPIPSKILYQNYVTLSDWKHEPDIMRLLDLIQTHVTDKNAKVLEIGCNDGKFLNLLRNAGYSNVVGIEPTEDAYLSATQKGINVIRGFFNDETTKEYNKIHGKCDFLVIRQVLEHIGDLHYFASMMEKVLSPGAFVLIEVPDFETCVTHNDYTLWEEHINNFTHETLKFFLSKINVDTLGYEKFLFSGTCLRVIGKLSDAKIDNKKHQKNALMAENIASYGDRWLQFKSQVNIFLTELKSAGKKIALYGAGNRTAAFVNFNNIAKYIEFVADDQLDKQTLLMSGSCLKILPSEQLSEQNIDIVLMGVNAESEHIIMNRHAELIKKGVIFYSILPPSDFLPNFWKDFSATENYA